MSRRGKDLGKWGEEQACLFLQRKGFEIIDRNFYTPAGEIDIVAQNAGDFYFVEVKTRQAGSLATDLAITESKKYKFGKTIKAYCYKRNLPEVGLIMAGLLVVVDRIKKTANFRFAVFT